MRRLIVRYIPLLIVALIGLSLPAGQALADCTWQKDFDLTASNGGFSADIGTYNAGVGWSSTSNGGMKKSDFFRNFSPSVLINKVIITYNVTSSFSNLLFSVYWNGFAGHHDLTNQSGATGSHTITNDIGSDTAMTQIFIFTTSSGENAGAWDVTAMSIFGTGTNPFGVGSGCGTATPTPTNTPTFTPSNTPTNTPTFTPSNTPTNTPTLTPTLTETPTPTLTPTETPTLTPTLTPVSTATDPPVPTALPPTPCSVNVSEPGTLACPIIRFVQSAVDYTPLGLVIVGVPTTIGLGLLLAGKLLAFLKGSLL